MLAFADDNINISQFSGNLYIKSASSTNNLLITVLAGGSIIDSLETESPNFITQNLSITAAGGSIGTAEDDIDIDLTASKLNALSNDIINIEETNGDLSIEQVLTYGNVTIKAYGSIIDNKASETPNIYGNNIYLNSSTGSIGSTTDNLDIYQNYNSTTGSLTAFAYRYINLHQYNGDLNLWAVSNAGRDDIKITSQGSILDAYPYESPNIYANDIFLYSYAGTLGTLENNLDINLNYRSTNGTLTAFAYRYINLHQYNGDLSLWAVSNAGRDDVKLTAQGSIIDGLPNENPNIYANDIYLSSSTGSIGTIDNNLDINLNYKSTNGGLDCIC